jgi:tRNA (guanine-N7-)-methyltransferase
VHFQHIADLKSRRIICFEETTFMARVRVHQHVNPLSPFYRFTPKPINIVNVFANPRLPIHLDIGCARGRFILKMAERLPERNFLGVEIREPLVAEGNRLARESNLTNLHYEFNNATYSLDKLLENLPADLLHAVTIQFPDPWYKKKHAKRRMVNDDLVETIVKHLKFDGKIFVQTDVDFLAEEMFEIFRENQGLREIEVLENPFIIKTERETAVDEKDLPIYRAMFEKK